MTIRVLLSVTRPTSSAKWVDEMNKEMNDEGTA